MVSCLPSAFVEFLRALHKHIHGDRLCFLPEHLFSAYKLPSLSKTKIAGPEQEAPGEEARVGALQ